MRVHSRHLFSTFFLIGFSLNNFSIAKFGDDSDCGYLDTCKNFQNFTEIYEVKEGSGDNFIKVKFCCPEGSFDKKTRKNYASRCQVSPCVDPEVASSTENICSVPGNIEHRWVDGEKIVYKEYSRNHCSDKEKNIIQGTEALCCSADSEDVMLTLLLGAEKHQFPHFARLHIARGDNYYDCGGTIYNEWYILTASHCVMEQGENYNSTLENSYAEVDVFLYSDRNPNRYDIAEYIAHPKSTRGLNKSDILYNDLALIKLAKPIEFNDNVKALPIAKPDFINPFLYSDQALIIGLGLTDTTETAPILQRANVLLRADERNIVAAAAGNAKRGQFTMKEAPGLLFAGGIQDGKSSPVSGSGDSGGPCICRDETGFAVLCGVDSSGEEIGGCIEALEKNGTSDTLASACLPEAYMEVAHYHDWIVSVAGKQKEEQLARIPLYGKMVNPGNYESQVHIEGNKDGQGCGGTLIKKDVVITAAHCVADDDGNQKKGLKVMARFQDLNSESKGKSYDVLNIKVHDGFKKGKEGLRRRRIAKLNTMPIPPQSPYYSNNLALVKLDGSVVITSLPKIGEPTTSSGSKPVWATEVSFPLDKKRNGKLQEREFRLFSQRACQHRMGRAKHAGYLYNVTVDETITCGEERYNGGTQCDRLLGGGLFCGEDDGKRGRETLCGIQTFRFCQLALPTGFLNLSKYKEWIDDNVNSL